MNEPLWKFDGFTTAAGRKVVREYLFELSDDDRDSVHDRIVFLRNLPKNLWMEPHYKNLGEGLGEIRDRSDLGALRVYGSFLEKGHFLMWNGHIKKKNNDREGLKLAKIRMKALSKGNGSASEFDIEEKPD